MGMVWQSLKSIVYVEGQVLNVYVEGQVLNVEFLRCSHDLRRVRSEAKRSPIAAATRPMMYMVAV